MRNVGYTSTEACIDFAAQAVFPLLILSQGDGDSVSTGRKAANSPYPGLRKERREARDLLGRKIILTKEAENFHVRFFKVFFGETSSAGK